LASTGFENWLLLTPIWLIGLVLFAGMAVAATVGWMIQRRREGQRGKESDKEDSHEGYLISAVLGLLALLTGFTFSLAIDRFDARRENVLIEANAIGTTYLRTQLLEEPHRTRISDLLKQYVDTRLALAKARPGRNGVLLKRNDQLLTDLWTATVAAFPTIRGYDFSSSYLETMNQMIDMDTSRKTARRAHVPAAVFMVLFVYQFMSAGALGYVLPKGTRGKLSAALVFFLFGLALLLVLDIDRPGDGRIRESQFPMELLQQSMRQPITVYDRFNAPSVPALPPS
jgi:hypothetical protein